MSKTNLNSLAVMGTGAALGLFIAAYVVRDLVVTEETPPCSTRYGSVLELPLTGPGGEPMTPIELDARAGISSFGLLDNAKVITAQESGAGVPALSIAVAKETGSVHQEETGVGGIAFHWRPSGMSGAASACLRYKVFLQDDIDFGGGGMLPGLFAGEYTDPKAYDEGRPGFATRLVWRMDGVYEVSAEMPGVEGQRTTPFRDRDFEFPRGRWVDVEEEVLLNSPGNADGGLGLWIDGALKVERKDIIWRQDDQLTLSGVVAEVSYGGPDNRSIAPVDTHILLSPIAISWR